MVIHRQLLTESADYCAARAELENETIRFVRLERASTEVVRIPVVVHVVYHDDVQNISDEQIHSQIAVLQEEFLPKLVAAARSIEACLREYETDVTYY